MLNFQPKKAPKPGAFTLDPVQRERAKAQVGRRRYFHLVFLGGVILITCYLFWNFMDNLRNALSPVTTRLNQEQPLPPMPKPSIASLPPLPEATAIDEHLPGVAEQLTNGTVPLWIDQPDASTLAWVKTIIAKDLVTPPLPQRVEARDLMLRHIKVGENLVISGLLEDSQPAPIAGSNTGYQRLLITLPGEQYLEVLAPENARNLVIGDEIVVVGRYLGFATLPLSDNQPDQVAPAATAAPAGAAPTATSTTGSAPETTAPAAASPKVTSVQVPLIAARIADKPAVQRKVDNPYVMRGEWQMPEDIYKNVDDDLLVVETRPYYYTLGQVLLDRTSPEALKDIGDANQQGSAIHREPSKYRGQPFTIRGHVFHAWEDPGVAHDQPFGVSRVVRIILWSEDWGDWDINEGGEIKTKRKLILRAFELAAITHQPLPEPGQVISASGRFLRLRSMEVPTNAERDRRMGIKRQSDRAHTFLFVTNDFTVIPPAVSYDFSLVWIIILVAALILGAALLRTARREEKKKELVYDSVRKLRESRQVLKAKRMAAAAAPTGESDATDATPPSPPPEPEQPDPPKPG